MKEMTRFIQHKIDKAIQITPNLSLCGKNFAIRGIKKDLLSFKEDIRS